MKGKTVSFYSAEHNKHLTGVVVDSFIFNQTKVVFNIPVIDPVCYYIVAAKNTNYQLSPNIKKEIVKMFQLRYDEIIEIIEPKF